MKNTFILLFIFLASSLLSSGVVNRDKPLKGNWNFNPRKTWEIENAGNDVIGKVGQIEVNDEGMVYVSDRRVVNYIFSKDGKFIKSFARRGEGPGEIKYQRAIFTYKDKVIIVDNDRVHYFTDMGKFIKSEKNDYYTRTPVICIGEHEFISVTPTIYYKPDGKGIMGRFNLKSGEERVIGRFPLFRGGIAREAKDTYQLWVVKELGPAMMVGYDHGNKRLYHGISSSYKINISDLNGNVLDSFSVEREKKKISASLKREQFKKATLPEQELKRLLNGFPDEYTYFKRIDIVNGMICVFLPDLSHKKRQGIDIFSLDGKYQYRSVLKFDDGCEIPGTVFGEVLIRIKGNHLYVVLEDEEGDVKIVKYKIALPGRE
ncbi:MAG: 6-bladed beta-propeller [bacterium]|nr:6-bladed beta-propeller [bacterium]